MSSVSGAQSRPHRMPVPRGPNSHLWVPADRKSQPRSGRSTSTAAKPCTPSTQSSARPSIASLISWMGSRTPVEECTQVTATTLVRGVSPATSRDDHLVHGRLPGLVVERDPLDRGTGPLGQQPQGVLGREEVVRGRQHLVARRTATGRRTWWRSPSSSSPSGRTARACRPSGRRRPDARRSPGRTPRAGCPPCRGQAGRGGSRSPRRPARCVARARTPRTAPSPGRAGTARVRTPSRSRRSPGSPGPPLSPRHWATPSPWRPSRSWSAKAWASVGGRGLRVAGGQARGGGDGREAGAEERTAGGCGHPHIVRVAGGVDKACNRVFE